MEGKIQSIQEIEAELDQERKELIKRALEGKATWGAWRYNPRNLTLEFDPKLNHNKGYPYEVDLERCRNSTEILDWLLQLQEKNWCPPEQVGYLLQAMNDLVGDLHKVVWGKRFDMGKYLRDLRKESGEKLLKVDEVADMLRVKKLTVYRMVKDKKLNVINLPIGRGRKGELRIPQEEVDKILGRHSAEGTE